MKRFLPCLEVYPPHLPAEIGIGDDFLHGCFPGSAVVNVCSKTGIEWWVHFNRTGAQSTKQRCREKPFALLNPRPEEVGGSVQFRRKLSNRRTTPGCCERSTFPPCTRMSGNVLNSFLASLTIAVTCASCSRGRKGECVVSTHKFLYSMVMD